MTAQYLILRSDNSFDMLSNEDTGGGEGRFWQATGTWQKLSNNQLKLTGGWQDMADMETFSFSEKITIREEYISGKEFFDKIYLK